MDYQLLPHEYMVMNSDHVSFGKNGLATDELILGTIYQITPTTRYSISIISKKATSVLEVAFSILIVVPF